MRHEDIRRYVPDVVLPPYTYVPGGHFSHPLSDRKGHSFGKRQARPESPDPAHWRSCPTYLYAIDLFNLGYYWEAHEAWESLWHACGRVGVTAVFLKGLIKLAAAGVKVREGKPAGVQSHLRRAGELFQKVKTGLWSEDSKYMGLCLDQLIQWTVATADHPPAAGQVGVPAEGRGSPTHTEEPTVEIVFDLVLEPV
jgi:hypothetical protein